MRGAKGNFSPYRDPLATGGRVGIEGFGRYCQHKLDIGFDLARVGSSLEKAVFYSPLVPDSMEVNPTISRCMIVAGVILLLSIPQGVEGIFGVGTALQQALDKCRGQ